MGFSRENLKQRIYDFIIENQEPFTSRQVSDSLAETKTGKMYLSPQRLGKFIRASTLVEMNKKTKKWEFKHGMEK